MRSWSAGVLRPLRLHGGPLYLSEPVAVDDSLGGVQHRLDADHAAEKRCVFAQIALADFSFRLHEPGERARLTCFRVFAAEPRVVVKLHGTRVVFRFSQFLESPFPAPLRLEIAQVPYAHHFYTPRRD